MSAAVIAFPPLQGVARGIADMVAGLELDELMPTIIATMRVVEQTRMDESRNIPNLNGLFITLLCCCRALDGCGYPWQDALEACA